MNNGMADNSALQSLYPFLHGARQDAARIDEALLESVRQKSRDSMAVKEAFFEAGAAQVVEVARDLAKVYENGGKLFTMGNGGSSCDAAHIAVEFLHPVTAGRPALPAVNLVADTAMIGVSTSGNSDNLLAAFARSKELGLLTIGLAGGGGGKMKESRDLDYCLVAPSDSIHRIQECHVAIYHILWDLVHTLLADKRGGLAAGEQS
jgi:D-sedoheptulose 7-phosphate isomerase